MRFTRKPNRQRNSENIYMKETQNLIKKFFLEKRWLKLKSKPEGLKNSVSYGAHSCN